jgi:hypothetical protein
MIYRSNLTAPDLTSHFRHLWSRVMPHSFGHDVPSDWADKADDDPVFGIYKRCGMWTHDEAAILYNVAQGMPGSWVDIGAHTGWTTAHIWKGARHYPYPIDPMFRVTSFRERFCANTQCAATSWLGSDQTSNEYFHEKRRAGVFAVGFCIDGDHEPGKPLEDARNAAAHLTHTGVIMLHDGVGRPVREAVEWLMDNGFKARAYFTPHLVFCCWRGDFVPPDHVPDPEVKRQLLDGRFKDFDFGRME